MKTGIIDVGGGLRGSYTAGVYDWCIDNGISFDYCMGISAGSANLSSFLAGQRGRNIKFYTEYNLREESMSLKNYLRDHNYVDLEYVYGEMSNSDGEYPLDYEAIMANPAEFVICATDAETGLAHFFTKADLKKDDYAPIKASSCVPAANRPYPVNGRLYYDGGIADPIPFEKCFRDGCDRIVLLLTRPRDYKRSPDRDRIFSTLIRKNYPEAAGALNRRAIKYNTELWLAKAYEMDGKMLIIAPDDIGDMSTLTKDREMIEKLYDKGYKDAEAIRAFLER